MNYRNFKGRVPADERSKNPAAAAEEKSGGYAPEEETEECADCPCFGDRSECDGCDFEERPNGFEKARFRKAAPEELYAAFLKISEQLAAREYRRRKIRAVLAAVGAAALTISAGAAALIIRKKRKQRNFRRRG